MSSLSAPINAIVAIMDWLLDPYLNHLSIFDAARAKSAGAAPLDWLGALARDRGQHNL